MDVGSSTGGFTDCMLQNGAAKVFAVDVGGSFSRPEASCVTTKSIAPPAPFLHIALTLPPRFKRLNHVLIMAGNVFVDGIQRDKAGAMFPITAQVELRGALMRYVSRGGLKLEKAVEAYGLDFDGMVCMDVGSSTGGFFPTFSLPASNCGLIRQTSSAPSFISINTGKSTSVREIKATSIETKS